MKLVIDDAILKNERSSFSTSAAAAHDNRGASELYFAKSIKHLISITKFSQLSAKQITVIYLSFTNVRISIALPCVGVSLEGGKSGTHSRK
jgi:hypothetical protein